MPGKISEARKQRLSTSAKLRWAAMTEEEKLALRDKARAAFEEKYPHRVRLYEKIKRMVDSGKIKKKPCQMCGSEKSTFRLAFDDTKKSVKFLGWSCLAHKNDLG